jgi:CBS-domain-containing membrane protein
MCEPMLKVREIMCKTVITAKENYSVHEAVMLLNDRHVGSIVVVDDEHKVIGIFTERDAIRLMANKCDIAESLGNVMSRHVVTVAFEGSFDEAKRLILSHNVRHLPVVDQTGKLVGLFSLRAFFDEVLGLKSPSTDAP